MTKKISPSIMCADFFMLDECIKNFEENSIDLIHVDIMDGEFVPNFTLGTDFIKALKEKTDIPLDIHLMINNPESKLDMFSFGKSDYVSVHYEATKHLHKAVSQIKSRGAKAVAALNPGTPVCVLGSILDDIDAVLLMTVDPGFAGQKMVSSAPEKIKRLREYLNDAGYENIEIEVDGNVSFENAAFMKNAGADIFASGTSGVFSNKASFSENTKRLRKILSD